jgi:shikimate kinase
MGTGKSAVGRALARKLKRRFVDLDRIIEKQEGMKINDIFAQKGELYFRQIEKRALAAVLGECDQVIATGGGALIDDENLRLVKDKALLVCLTASIDVLLKRIGSGSQRPLLKNFDRKSRIQELLRSRQERYAQADLSIDTTNLTIDQVAERIVELAKLER